MKKFHKNVELYFSRPNNEFVSLEQRVEFINTIQPDLVISLHANGHPQFEDKNGTEIFISKNNSFKDKNASTSRTVIKSALPERGGAS